MLRLRQNGTLSKKDISANARRKCSSPMKREENEFDLANLSSGINNKGKQVAWQCGSGCKCGRVREPHEIILGQF